MIKRKNQVNDKTSRVEIWHANGAIILLHSLSNKGTKQSKSTGLLVLFLIWPGHH